MSCWAQSAPESSKPPQGIVPAMALAALDSYGDPLATATPTRTAATGMVIYRVFVDADGVLQRFERFAGDESLQVVTELVLRSWHFSKVKQQKSIIPWWSFVGVCYSPDWGRSFPCLPPEGKPEDWKADSRPQRIYVAAGPTKRGEYAFAPIQKMKGDSTFVAPPLARMAQIRGVVILELIIGTDGRVSKVEQLGSGHPMLVPAAIQTVRGWRFAPLIFMGNSLESEMRVVVHYGSEY